MITRYVFLLLFVGLFAVAACERGSENPANANSASPIKTMQASNIAEPANAATPAPLSNAETMEVKVYFSAGDGTDCSNVRAVNRKVPKTEGVARAALNELFKGPTEDEKSSGLSSFFSNETRDILDGVKVKDGAAYVNLDESVTQKLGNATTSCGSQAFTASVEKTLTQFSTVNKVFFAIEGSPKDFYDWIQVGECPAELKDCSGKDF